MQKWWEADPGGFPGAPRLSLTERAPFAALVFEATSALGTVGLSTGITGSLSPLGALVIVGLMFAGRLGPLTFGSALLLRRTEALAADEEAEIVL